MDPSRRRYLRGLATLPLLGAAGPRLTQNTEKNAEDRRSADAGHDPGHRLEARTALFIWIEGWHNPRRRHSALNYLSPINFERKRIEQEDLVQEHGLPTAATGSSQAPPAAVDNPAPVQSSA